MRSHLPSSRLALVLLLALPAAGCRYYGSAVPPEYPVSMDTALSSANDMRGGSSGQRPVIRQATRPRVDRPSYLPEKELAIVSPPQTLLLWTYPHITEDNTRVFGSWSTIFLTDRYEWARPANELPSGEDDAGGEAGRPNLDTSSSPLSKSAGAVDGPPGQ